MVPAVVVVSSSAAARISPLLTLLHEQMTASAGSSIPAEPVRGGRSSSSGFSGSSMPPIPSTETIARSDPYADASPTRMPPSSRLPSAETTSFL